MPTHPHSSAPDAALKIDAKPSVESVGAGVEAMLLWSEGRGFEWPGGLGEPGSLGVGVGVEGSVGLGVGLGYRGPDVPGSDGVGLGTTGCAGSAGAGTAGTAGAGTAGTIGARLGGSADGVTPGTWIRMGGVATRSEPLLEDEPCAGWFASAD